MFLALLAKRVVHLHHILCRRQARTKAAKIRCIAWQLPHPGCFPVSRRTSKAFLFDRKVRGSWLSALLEYGRYHGPRPPFCSSGNAVDFYRGTIDEKPIRRFLITRQRSKYAFPDTPATPSYKAVIQSFLWSIARMGIGPTTARSQRVNYAGKNAAIIYARHSPDIGW